MDQLPQVLIQKKTFQWLKDRGYEIRLIHVSAPDKVRWESIQQRDKTFVQTTETDVKEKGMLVPQRINDTYLAFADCIDFYFRSEADQDAILAATWTRSDKEIEVKNKEAFESIKALHDGICQSLGQDELCWENSVG